MIISLLRTGAVIYFESPAPKGFHVVGTQYQLLNWTELSLVTGYSMPILKRSQKKKKRRQGDNIVFLDNLACECYLYLTEVILAETGIEVASVLALAKPFNIDDGLT